MSTISPIYTFYHVLVDVYVHLKSCFQNTIQLILWNYDINFQLLTSMARKESFTLILGSSFDKEDLDCNVFRCAKSLGLWLQIVKLLNWALLVAMHIYIYIYKLWAYLSYTVSYLTNVGLKL